MSETTEQVARDIWQQVYDMLDDVYPAMGETMNAYLRDTGCPDETTAIMTKTLVLLTIVALLNQPIVHQSYKKTVYERDNETGKFKEIEIDLCPLTKSLHSAKNVAAGFLFAAKTEGNA